VPTDTLIDDLHAVEKNYIEIEDALVLAEPEDVFSHEYDDMVRADVMTRLLRFIGDAAIKAFAATQESHAPAFDRGPRVVDRIANYCDVRTILRRTCFVRLVA
jgi:hypothetical protein